MRAKDIQHMIRTEYTPAPIQTMQRLDMLGMDNLLWTALDVLFEQRISKQVSEQSGGQRWTLGLTNEDAPTLVVMSTL